MVQLSCRVCLSLERLQMAELPNKRQFLPRYNPVMRKRPRVIAFVVAPPFELLDLTGPASVFEYASRRLTGSYLVRILSTETSSEVSSIGGLKIAGSSPFADFSGPIDTLIVLGGERALDPPTPEFCRWIRRRSVNVRRIIGVCAGAFLLAGAGVLTGKRVTTHWRYLDLLAARYKDLLIEREPIYIKDGKYYTCAGVSAGIDLALALVEEDHGHELASALTRDMLLFLRRIGSQGQLSYMLEHQKSLKNPFGDLLAWANANVDKRLDVASLAEATGLTPRTFARQFELHFQTTPARWVQELRVEAAKLHLLCPVTPIKAIPSVTGFRDEQSLRRAFVQQMSMTPKEYRERYREKTATSA
jgi:transcriptional regulator GlxA family with amidase domain